MSKKNREKRAAKAKAKARRAAAGAGSGGSTPGANGRTTPKAGSGPGSGASSGSSAGWPGSDPGPRGATGGRAKGGRSGHDHRQGHRSGGGRGDPFRSVVADIIEVAVAARRSGDDRRLDAAVEVLVRDLPGFSAEVAPHVLQLLASMWDHGWQPAEAVRHVRRGCPSPSVRLMLAAVAADHDGRDRSTLDPRWVAQLDGLDLPGRHRGVRIGGAWFDTWLAGETVGLADGVVAAIDVLVCLRSAPVLETLMAPPGAAPGWRGKVDTGPVGADTGVEADPVLEKVRALLAKAESTSFEAEAEAFTAKAQELIARHAIDIALLAGDDGDGPTAIRVFIDDPYADAKSLLLHVVAEAGRCRAVFMPRVSMSTCVGFASDIAAVEMMFTSLLVQAQTALAAAARSAPPGARTRSRGYRSSFLLSYSTRIGQRLEEISAAVIAESESQSSAGGRSILPVLASRDAVVDGAVDDLFGELHSGRVSGGHDMAGWTSGRFAADNAQLGGGFLAGVDA